MSRTRTWVATTPETLGATQYVAGFDPDKLLGHAAITYLITAVPSSTNGTVSRVVHDVDLYTGTGELRGSATATLIAPERSAADTHSPTTARTDRRR